MMNRKKHIAVMIFFTAAISAALAADTNTPDNPDAAPVEDVIAARNALMVTIEELMIPIDTFTVDETVDHEVMRENAEAIAAMLLAVPHLFPADSDLYDPDAQYKATLALPAIWKNFSNFYTLAHAASATATRLSETGDDPAALTSGSLALRGACDACHSLYLLPYNPTEVTPEDLEFDFDSVFRKD